MSPGIDRECQGPGATHHHACKCREEYFEKLRTQLAKAIEALEFCATNDFKIEKTQSVAREALRSIDESGVMK